MLLVILMEKKLYFFTKRNCEKQIKKNLKLKKVINKKVDKLCVNSKGYDNQINSWIDKKDNINE